MKVRWYRFWLFKRTWNKSKWKSTEYHRTASIS